MNEQINDLDWARTAVSKMWADCEDQAAVVLRWVEEFVGDLL